MTGKLLKDLRVVDLKAELQRRKVPNSSKLKLKAQMVTTLTYILLAEGNDPETYVIQVEEAEVLKQVKTEVQSEHQAAPVDNRKIVDDELLAIFECPICLETTLPPIYQCFSGHLICNGCRPKVDECSVCRCVTPSIRALVAEQVLATLWFPCKFPGCPELLKCKDKVAHEAKCQMRAVEIANLAGSWMAVMKNNRVRYEIPKLFVNDQFVRSARQFLDDNANVQLNFRGGKDQLTIICHINTGIPQRAVKLTSTMLMRSGEKRRNLPVVLSDANSSLESVWAMAYLPESIALEIELEFA